MKRLLVAVVALALAACTTGEAVRSAGSIAASAADAAGVPVPATTSALAEKALTLAAKAVDAAALSASALVRVGVIEPGSPTALRLAGALDTARDGVNAAALAREAGNATTYSAALDKATAALAAIAAIINGG